MLYLRYAFSTSGIYRLNIANEDKQSVRHNNRAYNTHGNFPCNRTSRLRELLFIVRFSNMSMFGQMENSKAKIGRNISHVRHDH